MRVNDDDIIKYYIIIPAYNIKGTVAKSAVEINVTNRRRKRKQSRCVLT